MCGSQKSLVTGAPMASALFAPELAGAMVVPLLLYHQVQLILCAILARRWATRDRAASPGPQSATA